MHRPANAADRSTCLPVIGVRPALVQRPCFDGCALSAVLAAQNALIATELDAWLEAQGARQARTAAALCHRFADVCSLHALQADAREAA